VVITWHCEDIKWVQDISPSLAPLITLVVLHKVNPGDLKDHKCSAPLPEVPFEIVEVQMPNRGRDVHSQFT